VLWVKNKIDCLLLYNKKKSTQAYMSRLFLSSNALGHLGQAHVHEVFFLPFVFFIFLIFICNFIIYCLFFLCLINFKNFYDVFYAYFLVNHFSMRIFFIIILLNKTFITRNNVIKYNRVHGSCFKFKCLQTNLSLNFFNLVFD
jgi:hypothetical protein